MQAVFSERVAPEPPLAFVTWRPARKGKVWGVYRHQAVRTNVIAVFLTQTYNSYWLSYLLDSIKIKLKPRCFL